MEMTEGPYRICTGHGHTDFAFVHRELSRSYWAEGIPAETVRRAAENSLCINVFEGEKQVAYARVITDKTTFAYLCDVIVDENERGKGIGKMLMAFILKHPELQGLRRFTLATKDAHGLYEKFGFTPLLFPDRHMEINRRNIYRQQKPGESQA